MTVTSDVLRATGASPTEAPPTRASRWRRVGRYLATANQVMVAIYGLLIALVFGAVLLILTVPQTQHALATFFDHPGASLNVMFSTVADAYRALFEGAIISPSQLWHSIQTGQGWSETFQPLSETFVAATPLIIAGIGVAISFQTGLFNIGGASQITMGAVAAAYVALDVSMPAPWHLFACLAAGAAGGALAGSIPGLLKAFTGAHEVIVTIMLNYAVGALLLLLLQSGGPLGLEAPNQVNDVSSFVPSSAVLPHFFGPSLRVNYGLVIALGCAVLMWWLLDRSTLGFRFRMSGLNPHASRTAGVSAKRITVVVFLVSGAFVGLAGVVQLTSIDLYLTSGGPQGFEVTIAFSAITAALLGRNRPLGIVLGAILIGALSNGAFAVEAATGVSTYLTSVIQAVMILCVAAPAFVAWIFHLRPGNASSLEFGGWV